MTRLEEVVINSQRLAPTSKRTYAMAARDFSAYAGSDPRRWTSTVVEAWVRQLKVSDRTRNNYLCAIKYCSKRWASLHHTYDFAAAVETVRVPAEKHPRSPTPLGEPQLDAMMSTCARQDDPIALRDRALLAVALHTGFRRRELAQVEFDDLDHRQRSIVSVVKRNKVHRVKLGAEVWSRLGAWLTWLRRRHVGSGRVFRALRRCLDAEMGWCVRASMTPESIWRTVKRRAKEAGIRTRVTTHSLRHSLAAILRDRGVPEEQIAKRLGHASVETTALYGRHEIVHEALDDELPS
jgi:integrase/recombinase XerD